MAAPGTTVVASKVAKSKYTDDIKATQAKSFHATNFYRIYSATPRPESVEAVAECFDDLAVDPEKFKDHLVDELGIPADRLPPVPTARELLLKCFRDEREPWMNLWPSVFNMPRPEDDVLRWCAWFWTAPLIYTYVNRAILDDDYTQLKKVCCLLKGIAGYCKIHRPQERLETFRGSRSTAEYQIGVQYRLQMLVATTTDSATASDYYQQMQRTGNAILLKFIIPKDCWNGSPIREVSFFQNEEEVILPPYTVVTCNGKSTDDRGRDVVEFRVERSNLSFERRYEARAKMYVQTQYYRHISEYEREKHTPTLDEVLGAFEALGCRGIMSCKPTYEPTFDGAGNVAGHLCEVTDVIDPAGIAFKPEKLPWQFVAEALFTDDEGMIKTLLPLLKRLRIEAAKQKGAPETVYRRVREQFKKETLSVLSAAGSHGVLSRNFVFCLGPLEANLEDGDMLIRIRMPRLNNPWFVKSKARGKGMLLPYTMVKVVLPYREDLHEPEGPVELGNPRVHMEVEVLANSLNPDASILEGLKIAPA